MRPARLNLDVRYTFGDMDLSVTGGVLYLAVGAAQFEGAVRPVAIAG